MKHFQLLCPPEASKTIFVLSFLNANILLFVGGARPFIDNWPFGSASDTDTLYYNEMTGALMRHVVYIP